MDSQGLASRSINPDLYTGLCFQFSAAHTPNDIISQNDSPREAIMKLTSTQPHPRPARSTLLVILVVLLAFTAACTPASPASPTPAPPSATPQPTATPTATFTPTTTATPTLTPTPSATPTETPTHTPTPVPLPETCGDFAYGEEFALREVQEYGFNSVQEAVAQWVANDTEMSEKLAFAQSHGQDVLLGLHSYAAGEESANINLFGFFLGTYQISVPAGVTSWGHEYPAFNGTCLVQAVPFVRGGEIGYTLNPLIVESSGGLTYHAYITETFPNNDGGRDYRLDLTLQDIRLGDIILYNYDLWQSLEEQELMMESEDRNPYPIGPYFALIGPALAYLDEHPEIREQLVGYGGIIPSTLEEQLAAIQAMSGGEVFPPGWAPIHISIRR